MEIRLATKEEAQDLREAGKLQPSVRLALSMSSCITPKEMHTNFYATLERGFTPINEHIGAYSGTCSIVGAGPSIKEKHKNLRGDVIAINSAIGYLLDHGIVPKFALLWDGTEIVEKFVRLHPDITYLVASRCHPKVFEKLAASRVIVWHTGGDHDIIDVMQRPEVIEKMQIPQPLILGGSAGVTRTLYLATVLGYSDIHIYGADSSYSDDGKTHVAGSVVPEKDIWITLGDDTPGAPALWFRTTPEWCGQVNEYRPIYALTVSGRLAALVKGSEETKPVSIEVHGKGLFKAMHDRLVAIRKNMGDEKFLEHVQFQAEEQFKLDDYSSQMEEEMKPVAPQPLGEENVRTACV